MKGATLKERYRVLDYVASGAMGNVYRILHLPSGALYALKELIDTSPDPLDKEAGQLRFLREADLLASLSHPSIPRIHDYFVEKGRCFMVMDYISGMDLEEYLSFVGNPGLDEKEALAIGIRLLDTLSYLHQQVPPIIFRDLKPANIMRSKQGNIYLIDFGIAKVLSARQKGANLGTAGYAPPEQYMGTVDERSDIYSLGATLHHLLTGRDPRNGEPFTFPPAMSLCPAISEALEAALLRALEKDTRRRFKSAAEMLETLVAINEGTATSDRSFRDIAISSGHLRKDSGSRDDARLRAHLAMGARHMEGGRFFEARQQFLESLKLGEDSEEALLNLGKASLKLNLFEEAKEAFSKALRLDPFSAEINFFRGLCEDLKGEKAKALFFFQRSLSFNALRTRELLRTHTGLDLCGSCSSIISQKARFCRYCGKPSGSIPGASFSSLSICQECGAEFASEIPDSFCKKCLKTMGF
ncbi:MAG: protein kinase [Candidatus Eremiobacteraeota bacterium]|nr:protein kinase [Candidatus Eremiobacteraeota bacterium]